MARVNVIKEVEVGGEVVVEEEEEAEEDVEEGMVEVAEGIVIEQGATIGFRKQLRRVWIDEHMTIKMIYGRFVLLLCIYLSLFIYLNFLLTSN